MSAINFVVRDVAGNISRGSVAGEGASPSLIVGAGEDVSLNLTRGQIISYTRQGQALEVTLIDGRVILLEGFFTMDGVSENELFLSAGGSLTEVQLTQGAGADYFANYVDGEGMGKFSASDDLYFARDAEVMLADAFVQSDDEVGMLGAALGGLAPMFGWGGAAAAAGAAAIIGLPGGGAAGSDPVVPQVNVTTGTSDGNQHVVNEEDHADGVEIGGTGTPGATVDVVIGATTETTTVDDDGTWEVIFDPVDVDTGEYTTPVEVTITNDGGTMTVTETLVVDTVIGVDIAATGGADSVINAQEYDGGVTLTGGVSGGDTIVVTIDGTDYAAVVTDTTWILDASPDVITAGDYHTHDVVVTATDSAGNTSSASSTIIVDTVTSVTVDTSGVGGGDNVVNNSEHPGDVALNGTTEAGAFVVVTLGSMSHTVIAGENGIWSTTYLSSEVPTGEDTLSVTVVATDLAGNMSTADGSVVIDTFVNELEMTTNTAGGSDGIVNFDESSQSITMAGTVEVGSTVSVNLHGVVMQAAVDSSTGAWTVTYPGGTLPGGEYPATVTVTATDAAGNTSSLSEAVQVDTVAGDLALSTQPIELDDVVSFDEASDGVVINGTATPGLIVTVGFGASSMEVLAQPDGTWSANFSVSMLPADTDSAQIMASITDALGNYKEVRDSVKIDTIVEPFNFSSEKVEGDDIINAAEAEDGVVFSGQVEPLSSVLVEFGGQKMTVSAGGNGQWSANFPASSIQHDEYTTTVTAMATHQHGNVSQPITRTIEVDTLVNELTTTDPVEGDNVVNYSEASDGVTLGGTVEAGSSVMVTFQHVNGSVSSAATVDAAGNWTIDFAASEIPGGDYDANVTILATDANGNTDSITDTFRVDTVDPDAPEITAVTITPEGVSSLRTETTDNDVTVNEITAAGTTNQLADQDDGFALPTDQTFYSFEPALPNGSHLVVNETDTSGNSNATFMVMEEAGTNAVDMGGLGGFDIGAIDLSFAKDSELTLDVSTLEGLSDADNNLIVHGGVDDSITLIGAANTGTQTSIGGNDYNVYTMGDDAQVFIEEDIVNVTI